MKWNAYDAQETYLGTVNAGCESDAMREAKAQWPEAVRVEERANEEGHQRP